MKIQLFKVCRWCRWMPIIEKEDLKYPALGSQRKKINPKVSRRKEITTIRAEINEIENNTKKKTKLTIQMINKINRMLIRITKKMVRERDY